jgi:selenocysteine lyase/cysteine desulfurase
MLFSDLTGPINQLAPHYSHFRVAQRLLLTAHSHQAWPDEAFNAQQQAWLDAAEFVDDKWERAFAKAQRVRQGFAQLLDDRDTGHIALGSNTHDLLVRLLSALPLRARPRLVTTDGEFHTIRRQLDRLEEEGIAVVRVPTAPHDALADRLAAAVDDRTGLVLVSSVLFGSGRIVQGLNRVMDACRHHGADLLVDTYHQLNAVPFSLIDAGLNDAFIIGGGYKYCQLGEGNCFLRFPWQRQLRPVITGWFAEFETLDQAKNNGKVAYDRGPGQMAGATYDPVSHYRAAAVFDFFAEMDLTPQLLRRVSQHQVARLADRFDALDLDPALITRDRAFPLEQIGGFLVLTSPRAAELCKALRQRGVWTDSRGQALRFGPAPYLHEGQLDQAMALLGEVVSADSFSRPER